jgi:hypothetical protein
MQSILVEETGEELVYDAFDDPDGHSDTIHLMDQRPLDRDEFDGFRRGQIERYGLCVD